MRSILLGITFGVGIAAPIWLPACATALPLVECQLAALKVLPDDPEQATVADARDVIQRVKACHEQAAVDSGVAP